MEEYIEMLKIKELKKMIEMFKDEDNVAIKVKEKLYDCYAYDEEFSRSVGHPCLVIASD